MSKLIFGFGVNDSNETATEYVTRDGVRTRAVKPIQAAWRSMLERCHSKSYKIKRPHYQNAFVEESWKFYSNFHEWAENKFFPNHQLDKDLLVVGNTKYSADTCLFIPPKINILLTTNLGKRNPNLSLGVTLQNTPYKLNKPYCAKVGIGDGKSKHLGYFETQEEAHIAWQIAKADYICECIHWWKIDPEFSVSFTSDGCDALQMRVDLLRSSAINGLIVNNL